MLPMERKQKAGPIGYIWLTNLFIRGLWRCTFPFEITGISSPSSTNDFVIWLEVNPEVAQISRSGLTAKLREKKKKIPHQSTASWRKILLCPGNGNIVRFHIARGMPVGLSQITDTTLVRMSRWREY